MDFVALKDATIVFVREHQSWAPFIVAALAFAESLAFLSIIAPATGILAAIGFMIVPMHLSFWLIWLGAVVGAVLGDWLSYWIGWRFKHPVLRIWPLSRHPGWVLRGERFFRGYGPWAVFIGRFFGPVRAVIPLIAGVFQMPLVLFQAANVASAMVWAFVWLAPGVGLTTYLGW